MLSSLGNSITYWTWIVVLISFLSIVLSYKISCIEVYVQFLQTNDVSRAKFLKLQPPASREPAVRQYFLVEYLPAICTFPVLYGLQITQIYTFSWSAAKPYYTETTPFDSYRQ